MTLKVVQTKKINTEDFRFKDIKNLTFPIPPLASANFYYNDDGVLILKIAATLYINSKDSEKPTVQTVKEEDNTFTIYFDYDWDNDSPDTYDVWYVETDYSSETVENITEVISYLQNSSSKTDVGGGDGDDPKTSRGTKTSAAT
ncbi:hypothetical protein ASF10_02160 [Flavobacterium sp. Leaf82]|jgi:hypothetical protein|uniref:hypothetical protein n=1 Tax=unclassified Flavobacterium TaxID=196869 RepID=UPI0007022A2E|nr:hypothetical protein [Flavobacterium sp. Leaf82]KQO34535.1 hypothetical protein ASF10_02160 [Flavobacterium sp. Leaf82]